MLSDGKFITVGTTAGDFAVARYNPDGSLDTTFDKDGIVTTYIGSSVDAANTVAVQPDGKLLVAGVNGYSNYGRFAIARYNADGSLDSSFDGDGIFISNSVYGYARSIALQPDGKAVIAGDYYGNFQVARYNRDGSLDSSFNGSGVRTTDLGSGTHLLYTVTVLSSGKIVAAGTSDGNFALVRYNSNGSLDTSFDQDGMLITALGNAESQSSMVMQADGKYVLAGTDSNYDIAVMRFNSDGSLDNSFGTAGKVTTDLGGSETANSVTVQADGKILVVGSSDTDFALVRYNTDGSLDNSFNGSVINPPTNNAPTGAVTINDTTPTVGQVLTASNTLADADGLGAITYTWKNGSTVIGTGNTYTVTAGNLGNALTVIASYTDLLGTAESKISAVTAPVAATGTITTPGFTFTPLNGTATGENGAAVSYAVSLNSPPVRDVTLNFKSSNLAEGVINSGASMTFTSSNWNSPQTLTVKGVDDSVDDGDMSYQIKATLSSIDIDYKLLTVAPLKLSNIDNDAPLPPTEIYGDQGGSKSDVIVGTAANDTIYGLNKADDLSGSLGNDTLWGGYGQDNLFGDAGNDTLYGEQDADYMEGGAGNDILDGGLGVDTMIGGAGNDTYYLGYDAVDIINDKGLSTDVDTVIMPYQSTNYTLPANIENGTIAEGTQASNLTGNDGNNALTGNAGANKLNGGAGTDSLNGGSGNDSLNGGSGIDAATYSTATAGVKVDLSLTTAQNTGSAGTDTLSSIENIIASNFVDNLTGSSANNVLVAGAGNDVVNAGNGNDTLSGDAGNDTLNGGSGTDAAAYTSATAGVKVDLSLTTAQNTGSAGTDTLSSIENIIASKFNDTLKGNDASNTLIAGSGNDVVNTGKGNDTVSGDAGNDTINGGSGNDVLAGGSGNDTLTGGAGADSFQFDNTLTANVDKITDFVAVDDTIQLENAIFTRFTQTGSLNAANFKLGATATDNNDYLIYNPTSGALYYDADANGAGAAVQLATLGISAHPTLTSADFMVI